MSGLHLNNQPSAIGSAKPYFPALDGIRWILVLIVMGFHMSNDATDPKNLWIKRYVDGMLAVDVFFIISGFLITYLLLREEREKKSINIKKFYIRRVFRLLPVYFLAIFTYLAVGLTVPGQEIQVPRIINALPYYLTLRNEYVPADADFALGHSWSLSVEEKFYIIWPALFFLIFRSRAARWIPFFIALALGLLLFESKLYFSYLSIISGCLVAYVVSMEGDLTNNFIRISRSTAIGWISFVALVCAYFVTSSWAFPSRFVFSIAFLPFLLHLIFGASIFTKILSTRPMTAMGQKAYAMYLFHMVVVNPMQSKIIPPTNTATYLLCLCSSYLVLLFGCTIIYRYFERPLILKGRRFG